MLAPPCLLARQIPGCLLHLGSYPGYLYQQLALVSAVYGSGTMLGAFSRWAHTIFMTALVRTHCVIPTSQMSLRGGWGGEEVAKKYPWRL